MPGMKKRRKALRFSALRWPSHKGKNLEPDPECVRNERRPAIFNGLARAASDERPTDSDGPIAGKISGL
jgi:hypothetical protein